MSPFIVAKVLENLVGFAYKAKKLHSGDLLVEVNTAVHSHALLNMTNIVDVKVSVSPHRTLNTIRGVISEDDLLDSSEEEILEGLKHAGVVAVKRIIFRKNGQETPSKHLILTFERHELPVNVKAGYLHCRVRPYIPNPQRCYRCQRFGHGTRSCRGRETCAKCGSEEHVADVCESIPHCSNCNGPHPAYSRACPLFQQEKEILALKAKENIPYPEAKKRFSFLSKGGYAKVVRGGPAPRLESRATQVSPEMLVGAHKAPPSQHWQLPPAPGVSTRAASKNGPAAAAAPVTSGSPPREKERAARSGSLERPFPSKERHDTRSVSCPKGVEPMDMGSSQPSTSTTPTVGSGRGRRPPSRVPDHSKPLGKPVRIGEEMEVVADATDSPTPSDHEDSESQTRTQKHKTKKPVLAPT